MIKTKPDVLYVRDPATGKFVPLVAIKGEKGDKGDTDVDVLGGQGITTTKNGKTITVASNAIISQTDITAGSTALMDGQSYYVYE